MMSAGRTAWQLCRRLLGIRTVNQPPISQLAMRGIKKMAYEIASEEELNNYENAINFSSSFRGRYIIGQALFYAIKELESVEPEVHQEKSNIEDMKYLRDELFNFPDEMYTSQTPIKGIRTDIDLTFEENGNG